MDSELVSRLNVAASHAEIQLSSLLRLLSLRLLKAGAALTKDVRGAATKDCKVVRSTAFAGDEALTLDRKHVNLSSAGPVVLTAAVLLLASLFSKSLFTRVKGGANVKAGVPPPPGMLLPPGMPLPPSSNALFQDTTKIDSELGVLTKPELPVAQETIGTHFIEKPGIMQTRKTESCDADKGIEGCSLGHSSAVLQRAFMRVPSHHVAKVLSRIPPHLSSHFGVLSSDTDAHLRS